MAIAATTHATGPSRDGKAARIVEYFDETEALGAIGL
jgi:hypothetical protein